MGITSNQLQSLDRNRAIVPIKDYGANKERKKPEVYYEYWQVAFLVYVYKNHQYLSKTKLRIALVEFFKQRDNLNKLKGNRLVLTHARSFWIKENGEGLGDILKSLTPVDLTIFPVFEGVKK